MILPQTALPDAVLFAGSLRATLKTKDLVHRTSGRNFGSVTISIGAAELRPAEAPEDLIGRADQALSAAKAARRSRLNGEPKPVSALHSAP